jgi:hypothetical protein
LNPTYSPDGNYVAFAGDREGHGLDIFLLNRRNPDEERYSPRGVSTTPFLLFRLMEKESRSSLTVTAIRNLPGELGRQRAISHHAQQSAEEVAAILQRQKLSHIRCESKR